MASIQTTTLALLLFILSSTQVSHSRELKQKPKQLMTYHKGAILQGDIPLKLYWYGQFTQNQKLIITNFLQSITPNGVSTDPQPFGTVPSVAQWWRLINNNYVAKAINNAKTNIFIDDQVMDTSYSAGKLLKLSDIAQLATKASPKKGGITIVLTSQDVAVEGFGMSRCGLHNVDATTGDSYIWLGNSITQCPGQCAWPFSKPLYGPPTSPLGSPNNDTGADGMVIVLSGLLASTVTNPNGTGFYKGTNGGKVEVATACSGIFGQGAYPGNAGNVLKDGSGASYNCVGNDNMKHLLPALFDPLTSSCLTLV